MHTRLGIIVALLTSLSLVMGCASSPYVGTGAAVGGGLGALTGAAIGNRNPWQGAAIGGLLGAALGAGGGYLLQQRQAGQASQGYYDQQPGYGYSAPPPAAAPPAYAAPPGYNSPAPGYGPPSGLPQAYSSAPPPGYYQQPEQQPIPNLPRGYTGPPIAKAPYYGD